MRTIGLLVALAGIAVISTKKGRSLAKGLFLKGVEVGCKARERAEEYMAQTTDCRENASSKTEATAEQYS